ncbi:MAG: radical SAM protein, partial [Pseudomonadota bacterium]
VTLLTKSALIQRDLDLLAPMAKRGLCRVGVSITTLDPKLCRKMEPRAASPRLRLATVKALAEAGIDVTVMMAPIIPALNEAEMETLTMAAADHGAVRAGYVLLRLPYELKDVVQEWFVQHVPDRAARIINLLRDMRGGKDYDAEWFQRGTGQGEHARFIAERFAKAVKRAGLNRIERPPLRTDLFSPPVLTGGQYALDL